MCAVVGSGSGTELAMWDPVLGIPPSVWRVGVVWVLLVVLPVIIGWLYSDGYMDCGITQEWWRIVVWDERDGRLRVQVMLAFGVLCGLGCLSALVAQACDLPKSPREVLSWRHQMDVIVGVLMSMWLMIHGVAWLGAVDLVEGRRRRLRRRLRRVERERKERALAKRAQEAERELGRVARMIRRERREILREQHVIASADGAGRSGASVSGAVGRSCGRGGGRVGGCLGVRSAMAVIKVDPIQAAWDLETDCHRLLGGVREDYVFELKELKGWEHRVEQAMLRLDSLEMSGAGTAQLRQQRRSALMGLEVTWKYIDTLIAVVMNEADVKELL